MKLIKEIGTALCLVVLCLVVAPKAKAIEQPGNAVVTFAVPVEVPGIDAQILPAGTYRFTVLESAPDRDIIQISSPDGSHVFTTLLGVPNSRLKAPDLITVVFTGRPAADPLALKAWYCPGRTWGDQIVYEKPRATQLAKEINEPVLSTSVVQAMSSQAVLKSAVIEAVGPGGDTVAIAQFVDAPPVVAPALAVAVAPSGAATVGATEGSTAAVASSPVAVPVVTTEATVAATPAAAIEPPATSATPATTDPAAASAPTPIGEPAATPAPAVAVVPVVAVAPVAPAEPAVASAPVATAAPTVTAEPTVAASHEMATATLPRTASLLPLIGLVGLLMLGAGFLLTNLMKRRA
jgi:hypothetical protein